MSRKSAYALQAPRSRLRGCMGRGARCRQRYPAVKLTKVMQRSQPRRLQYLWVTPAPAQKYAICRSRRCCGASATRAAAACPFVHPRLTARTMCARRFLLLIFWLTLIVVAAGFAIFQYGGEILQRQMVPKGHYVAAAARQRPGLCGGGKLDRAARHGRRPVALAADGRRRRGRREARASPSSSTRRPISSATAGMRLLDDRPSQSRAELFVRSQASAFNEVAEIWAPRYRQAAFGAFLLDNQGRDRSARPRLWRRAARPSTSSSPPSRPTARSSSPGTARARSI